VVAADRAQRVELHGGLQDSPAADCYFRPARSLYQSMSPLVEASW
jgi:hypothetical protein